MIRQLKLRALDRIDDTLHRRLDRYIDDHRPGWQIAQHVQWKFCNAYEAALWRCFPNQGED